VPPRHDQQQCLAQDGSDEANLYESR
jgi:hypothetical protein